MTEDDIIAAAQAIVPHLPVLVGDDAAAVRDQLEALLQRTAGGEPVKVELLRVLAQRTGTRNWVRALLDVPETARAYVPLPGESRSAQLPRYACPEDDQPPWFRFDVRDQIPRCPIHGVAYVRVDA